MDNHAYLNWNSKNGATKVQNEGFGISEICNCSQEEMVFLQIDLKMRTKYLFPKFAFKNCGASYGL